jgi:hypothetical protein
MMQTLVTIYRSVFFLFLFVCRAASFWMCASSRIFNLCKQFLFYVSVHWTSF